MTLELERSHTSACMHAYVCDAPRSPAVDLCVPIKIDAQYFFGFTQHLACALSPLILFTPDTS